MNLYNLNLYNLKEKTEDMFIAEVFISEDSPFFDGHFENFKLFPAIAQIKTVLDISKEVFNIDFNINKLSKIKFINMIFPNSYINMESRYLNNTISFKIYDKDKKYSEGKAHFTLL